MASLNLDIPDDFMKDLLSASFDDIATDALEEVEPILKESIQNCIRAAEKGSSTGELVNSIKGTKPKKTKTDAYIVNVGPSGQSKTFYNQKSGSHTRKYPVSNALKAIWLNYGNAHQAPRPWLTPAINNVQNVIQQKLQKIWEERTKT